MAYTKQVITSLLICSTILCGAPLSAAPLHARAPFAAQQESPGGAEAAAERGKGRTLLRQGRAAEALVHLEKALKLYQQEKSRSGEASVQDLLGELYERQGRYETALGHYKRAHELFAALASEISAKNLIAAAAAWSTDGYNANLTLAKIGNMYSRQGRVAEANAAFTQMIASKPDTSALGQAKKTGGLFGKVTSIASGGPSLSTATGAASIAGERVKAYQQTMIYATRETGLGQLAYEKGEFEAAKKHFEGAAAATKGDLPFLGKLGQAQRFRAVARTGLGDIAFKQGRYTDAVKLYTEASKGAQEDKRLDLMWPAQRGLGRSLWAQAAFEKDVKKASKLREESIAAFRQSLSTIETLRQGSVRSDEARTSFIATTGEVFGEAAAALAEMALMAQANPSAPLEGKALEYAAESLRVVEQGRARSLLDMLNETGVEITEGVPAELVRRRRENQARQAEIAEQLSGVKPASDAPVKPLDELEAELTSLQTEFESIENQIRTASPRYAALTTTQPLTLAEIQQRVLDEETTLLEYSLGEKTSYLYAVSKNGAALYRLPARAEIEQQAVAVREQIIPASLRRALLDTTGEAQRGVTVSGGGAGSPAAGNFAAAANALYKMVVEPATAFVGERRLLVVADGALNYIPFHALVTAVPAAGADYATLAYLVNKNDVVFAPSASVVAVIRQQAQGGGAKTGGSMLLVADPVFSVGDTRAQGAAGAAAAAGAQAEAARGLSSVESAVEDIASERESKGGSPTSSGPGRPVALARLKGTRAEAQQIAGLAKTTGAKADVWLDLDASEANVEGRDLSQYGVVHFATHGLLNTERPQFTGVVLSLVGNKMGDDGFLRTDEIFNLRLSSPLVMLSACETGLGKEKKGEGVIGLTRAFMYAGAPTVGVSLWSVADQSTADLMTDFYRNLLGQTGATPGTAMRAARQNMIAGKKYSAPFYWAPFVMVGDWR